MGLKDDINEAILDAFDNDLIDATRIIQIPTITSVYDEDTMQSVNTEVNVDVRAVKIEDKEGEILDSTTESDTAKFLVMDNDRVTAGITFIKDMKVIDDGTQYLIKGIDTDPAKASYILICRIWS